ncbi:RagB/SusD family nutrient uptake outer membrane protein [Pedobacter psychrodurus]|uniref:RagB/SusD family nutrient uptake outer membrane protein n=1 Tax=Pedobacter psychrodurus TaxID=2530456 RepID=UPI00292EA23A|nr:RagB/SusD family nutrient uptake outer membrane protein [Pedobacter psychrodurus]
MKNIIFLKRKSTLFIILCICITFSCKKVLNPDVIQLPTSENAFSSGADIDKGIAAAYGFLRIAVPDKVFLFNDVRANTFASYSDNVNVAVETPIPRNTQTSLLANGGGDWRSFYKVISQCNLILEKIPTIANYDAETKKRHLGEASFIRALSYFYLVRFWGDVPINLKSIDIDIIKRNPQTEVLQLINKDLDIAIANLKPFYNAGDRAVRATKGAAWAIKAHVKAWQQDYSSCEKLCDSVITNGQYTMVKDTTNLISIFIGKTSEGIFELNNDASLKEVQMNRIYYRTMHLPYYNNGGIGAQVLLFPPPDMRSQMFPKGVRDARLRTWFVANTFGYTSTNYPYLGKYRTLQASGDTTSKNINESNVIITRLPDIMLLRAEALASSQLNRTPEAITLLNKVRERAYAPLYLGGGSIQDTILLERRKELLGEGQIFFDLVRTRKLDKYSRITDANWYARGAWLLPIDQSIIAKSNFVITQNSFWQ